MRKNGIGRRVYIGFGVPWEVAPPECPGRRPASRAERRSDRWPSNRSFDRALHRAELQTSAALLRVVYDAWLTYRDECGDRRERARTLRRETRRAVRALCRLAYATWAASWREAMIARNTWADACLRRIVEACPQRMVEACLQRMAAT